LYCIIWLMGWRKKCDPRATMKLKAIIILLAIAIVLVPLVVVQVIRPHQLGAYAPKVRVTKFLDQNSKGLLKYFLVERVEGEAPGDTFVIAVQYNFSEGISSVEVKDGQILWVQGPLMTEEIYHPEYHLFFGYPQIYVYQVKGRGLWPDQLIKMREFYLSPFTSLIAPIGLLLPLGDGHSLTDNLVLAVKTILLGLTAFLTIRLRRYWGNVILILLSYSFLAMILTAVAWWVWVITGR